MVSGKNNLNNDTCIFDKIMNLPGIRILQPFYKKNKELLLYLFFGGLTFFVSIFSYSFFSIYFLLNELVANIISWIFAVLFAYITNRKWVFRSTVHDIKHIVTELSTFFSGRILTLIVEEILLLIFIVKLDFNSIRVKIVAQIIVIVLNYVISKLVIFKEK